MANQPNSTTHAKLKTVAIVITHVAMVRRFLAEIVIAGFNDGAVVKDSILTGAVLALHYIIVSVDGVSEIVTVFLVRDAVVT